MTKEQLEAAARSALGPMVKWVNVRSDGSGYIEIDLDYDVSFEQLSALSVALGTRDLNLNTEHGFGGSDVTPADDDITSIHVRWPK